jgi:hypothetical protein
MAAMEQGHERGMIVLKALHNKITQELTQASEQKRFNITKEKRTELARYKAELEKKIAKKKAEAGNRVAIGQGMMAVGTAAMTAGPYGWAVGGALILGGTAIASGKVK